MSQAHRVPAGSRQDTTLELAKITRLDAGSEQDKGREDTETPWLMCQAVLWGLLGSGYIVPAAGQESTRAHLPTSGLERGRRSVIHVPGPQGP